MRPTDNKRIEIFFMSVRWKAAADLFAQTLNYIKKRKKNINRQGLKGEK